MALQVAVTSSQTPDPCHDEIVSEKLIACCFIARIDKVFGAGDFVVWNKAAATLRFYNHNKEHNVKMRNEGNAVA